MSDYFAYRQQLAVIATNDVREVMVKDVSYGGSWKRGGGRSAWFQLRRKIDRMLEMMKPPEPPAGWPTMVKMTDENFILLSKMTRAEDVFAMISSEPTGADGTVLAEVRDLRRYLLLVEAEMVARGDVELVGDVPNRGHLGHRAAENMTPGPAVQEHRGLGRDVRQVSVRPGTPEDGGHHARMDLLAPGGPLTTVDE